MVLVSEDSEMLALAAELGLEELEISFEHATGVLLAYPTEGEDCDAWTLIRRLSHE